MRWNHRRENARIRTVLLLGMIALLWWPASGSADTGSDPELRAKKVHWQTRYRDLLSRQRELHAIIGTERELYADANRRNYRRGSKRHTHRKAMLEAQAKLEKVEQKLSTIEDDARRAGALPGWLYDVEMEFEDAARRPAVGAGPGDDGRNPLYRDRASD
jgi:hypothetical protein